MKKQREATGLPVDAAEYGFRIWPWAEQGGVNVLARGGHLVREPLVLSQFAK